MVQNWRLLTLLLSLPMLPLLAEESAAENLSQEIAYDETAYVSKKEQRNGRRKAEKALPEEESIRSVPVITPPVAPHIVDGTDSYVVADFIWWKTQIDGMEYAYSGVADGGFAVPVGTDVVNGDAYGPAFQFQPGVKVGLGWHFDHDGWDMLANYTYLASGTEGSNQNEFSGSGSGMHSVQSVVLNNGTQRTMSVSSASNKWRQDFNVIDLELGRDFFLSRFLTLRPHFGFKSAWIHETTTTDLTPVPATTETVGTVVQTVLGASLNDSEHMWGIGIRAGLDTGWHFSKNWLFYGNLAFTNLWGKFSNQLNQTLTENTGSSKTQSTSNSYQTVIPVIEAGAGLGYITWFNDSRFRFEVRLGWEEQVWISYNRSQDFLRSGNLTVNGLTLKTMLNF